MAKVYDNATDLITFARSSSGTALRRVGYGPELVDNGGFSLGDNGDWTKGTGWTISGGVATLDGSQVSSSDLSQQLTLKANTIYQVSLDVTNVTTALDLVTITSTGGPEIQNLSATGTYTAVFVAPSTSEQLIIRGTSSSVANIDNISVKEVIFDRATDPLVLFNHPDDIPRIEYGSDGSLKGLLIEEQRTNLLTYSEDFSQWTTGSTTVEVNTSETLSPSGQNNATKVTWGGSVIYAVQSSVKTGAPTITGSVWVKGAAGETVRFAQETTGGTYVSNYTAFTLTGGWQRIDNQITLAGNNDNAGTLMILMVGNTNPASSVYIYGAQIEQGSFATSYIPTSGSQQTRSADVASIPVTAFGYNQDAGTVVVEAKTNNPASSLPHLWQLDANVSNTRLACTFRSSSGAVRMFIQNGGSTDASLYRGTPLTDTTEVTTAGSWQADDIAFSYDGSAVAADTNGCAIPSVSTLRIGSSNVTGTTALNGHIKSIQYYPRRLTNTQLQELTS